MPRGGARPGAGRKRKGALLPDAAKIAAQRATEEIPESKEEQRIHTLLPELEEGLGTTCPCEEEEQAELPGLSLRRKETSTKEERLNERSTFTSQQIAMLMESPYVSQVTLKTVSYTKTFKELLWTRYCNGEPPELVFAECGIDPQVIGKHRIDSQLKTIRSVYAQGLELTDGRKPVTALAEQEGPKAQGRRKNGSTTVPMSANITAAELQKLYQRVAYLTQEMDFLKKIMLRGRDNE